MPLMAAAKVSTPIFSKLMFSERFYRPFNPQYQQFFQVLDDDTNQFSAIAAPRGVGKTTGGSIAFPARKISFQDVMFVLMISCTANVANQNVRNLGRELSGNEQIRSLIGDLKGPIWAEGTGHLETSTGIHIFGRGAGQQVRGLLEGGTRPDLVLVDDLEDPEPFRLGDPTAYLRNIKEWFWADLMNSIDRRRTRVVVVGTVLHEASLLSDLLEDKRWASVRLELCDDNYRSNFPEYMSDQEVADLAESFASRGQLDLFYREYRNQAIAAKDAVFTQDLFKRWALGDIENTYMDRVVIVDPAKTVKVHSDHSAIQAWGFDNVKNRIYQLDLVDDKLHQEKIYEESWRMAMRLKTTIIGVEVTSLNEFITYPFNNFLRSKGFPPVIELKAKGKKEGRIAQLAPLYRMGAVYHHPDKRIHGPLESQLLVFPRGKRDDVIDNAAYTLEMFNLGARFFSLPENEDQMALEQELAELDRLDQEAEPLGDGHLWAP